MAIQHAELWVFALISQEQKVSKTMPFGGSISTKINFLHGHPQKAIEDKVSVELDPHCRVDFFPEHVLEAKQAIIWKYNILIL